MLLQSDPSRLCISSFLVDSLAKASIAQHRRRMSGHSDWCLNLRNGLAAGCCVVVLLLLSLLCLVAPCGGVLLLLCVSVCFLLLTTLLRGARCQRSKPPVAYVRIERPSGQKQNKSCFACGCYCEERSQRLSAPCMGRRSARGNLNIAWIKKGRPRPLWQEVPGWCLCDS